MAAIFAIGVKISKAIVPLQPIKPKFQLNPNAIDADAIKAWHEARCAKFKEKLETKISNIEEKQANHNNALNNLVSRFETLISRLDSKGYDVGQLKTDLNTLNDKIDNFKDDSNALAEQVKNTKEAVCDDTDTKIKTNLGETRTLVQKVRSDVKEIRTFYKNEIRSDIRELRNQNPESEQ